MQNSQVMAAEGTISSPRSIALMSSQLIERAQTNRSGQSPSSYGHSLPSYGNLKRMIVPDRYQHHKYKRTTVICPSWIPPKRWNHLHRITMSTTTTSVVIKTLIIQSQEQQQHPHQQPWLFWELQNSLSVPLFKRCTRIVLKIYIRETVKKADEWATRGDSHSILTTKNHIRNTMDSIEITIHKTKKS